MTIEDLLAEVSARFEQAGLHRDGALLLRPDGHICARWLKAPEDPQAAVDEQVNEATGR